MDNINNFDDKQHGWSHVNEIISMVSLAIAQIEIAITESNSSVDHLTDSFTKIVESTMHTNELLKQQQNLVDGELIATQLNDVKNKVREGVIAFQFYDKLVQRLQHVTYGLNSLAGLIKDHDTCENKNEWASLKSDIRDKYSMEAEREMFDAIFTGKSHSEAVALYNIYINSIKLNSDNIELF